MKPAISYPPDNTQIMKHKPSLFPLVLTVMIFSILQTTHGGDAVAVTYDGNGNVTSADTEYSSTKSDGKDYMKGILAAEKALTAVKARLAYREGVIHSSDLTGFFAFAIGTTEQGQVKGKVGYGKTQAEADENALKKLSSDEATKQQTIQVRYFSYGENVAPR
ncbi:MAG: hypothetical protein WCN98_08720 [Verrucomicrobiaceae bacterium]